MMSRQLRRRVAGPASWAGVWTSRPYRRPPCGTIAQAGSHIQGLGFEEFRDDPKTVGAVLRWVTVIGEAVASLPEEETSSHPDIPWHWIRGIRNVVVHEHFGISLDIFWQTVTEELPALDSKLKALLRD